MVAQTIDEQIRLVNLQFVFTDSDKRPFIKKPDIETSAEVKTRRGPGPTGVMFVGPAKMCSVLQFVNELEATGYELVYAFSVDQPHAKRLGKTRHDVRFIYVRREHAEISDKFRAIAASVRVKLQNLTENALWQIRVHKNPFYQNGEAASGVHAMSVYSTERTLRSLPDGQPVVEWRRDEAGNRVGDKAESIQSKHTLRIVDGAIVLS